MKPHPIQTSLLITTAAVSCAGAAEAIKPSTDVVPPPAAANEILSQSARESTLRLGPIDIFPHASLSTTYDDNLLISHEGRINDQEWTVAPGLMVALGDVSTSLPGPVTMGQLRNLLYYSIADSASKPRRFLGVDYTPAINFYIDHDQFNNVDHPVHFTGGYNFSRMTVEADFDFVHGQFKDNGVGDLVTINDYNAALRTRYDLSELTSLEVNGHYLQYDYVHPTFQGYWDIRNEDWLNHQFGEKVTAGLGGAFGYMEPQDNPYQTYEQLLFRGIYRATGKLFFDAHVGVEWREYHTGAPNTVKPVFSIAGVYVPQERTTLTLEAHRREEASPFPGANFTMLGFTASVRQRIGRSIVAGLTGGYDNYEYNEIIADNNEVRNDNYFNVSVNVDYEFNPHWTGTIFYTYRQDSSDVVALSYYNNLVGARLLWQF